MIATHPASTFTFTQVRPTVDRTESDELVFGTSPLYADCDTHMVMRMRPKPSSTDSKALQALEKQGAKHAPLDVRVRVTDNSAFDLLCTLGLACHDSGAATKSPAKKKAKTASSGGGRLSVQAEAINWQPIQLSFVVPPNITLVKDDEFGCAPSSPLASALAPTRTLIPTSTRTQVHALISADAYDP